MNTFNDKAGQEVKVGDFIVYAHGLGRCSALQFGRVFSIVSEEVPYHYGSKKNKTLWKIGVRGIEQNSFLPNRLLRAGTLLYPDRIILANDFMPSVLKELYERPATI